MITIAGSGPSTATIDHVTVATKKRSVPSDYIFCRFPFSYNRWDDGKNTPLMYYYNRCGCDCGQCALCKTEKYCINSSHWDAYYRHFTKSSRPPAKQKPSTGLCAVFGVVERWNPETIGLIGFDYILDGNSSWEHNAAAERQCILSLVNIVDLRNDKTLCRL